MGTKTAAKRVASKLLMAMVICQLAFVGLLPMSVLADSCIPPSTTYGMDVIPLSISTAGNYTIWTRLKLPVNSTDSLLLNVDGMHCYDLGGSASTPTNTWEWVSYSDGSAGSTIQLSLSQGTHTIAYAGINGGAQIDRVEALAQTSCIPSGTGDNCLASISTAPSTVGSYTSSNNSPWGGIGGEDTEGASGENSDMALFGGTSFLLLSDGGNDTALETAAITHLSSDRLQINAPILIKANAVGPRVKKVEYVLNDRLLATEKTYPYRYELNSRDTLNGTYTLSAKTFFPSGRVNTVSEEVVVKNPPSFTQFRLTAQKYAFLAIFVVIILGSIVIYLMKVCYIKIPFSVGKKTPPNIYQVPSQININIPKAPAGGRYVAVGKLLKGIDLRKPNHRIPVIALVLLVGSVGVHQLFFGHVAMVYYTNAQASYGTISGGASVIPDPSASEGKSVQFVAPGSSGGSTGVDYTVSGNSILNASGQKVLLHGIDRPTLESSCSGETVDGSGGGIPASDFATMRTSWNANVVRLPVSEDRWLSGTADSCSTYQATVAAVVKDIEADGMIAIIDLQWSDQGSNTTASGQQCMPDQNSVAFWQQVASQYKSDPNVWFELYNEPYPPGSTQAAEWNVWQNGGQVTCSALIGGHTATWMAPGMQELINTVRATGANNIAIAGGLNYSSTLANVPSLTGGNVAYAIHPYDKTSDPNGSTDGTWASNFGSEAAKVPVIATEFGDQQCGDPVYENAILPYFHEHNIGYTAGSWYVSGCSFPSLITNVAGTCVNTMGCTIQTDMKNQ